MASLLQCYNKGCGKKFDPKENVDGACVYHPGQPVFHDIYKKWSCCSKKTTDFTEFLNIKGCATGLHNAEKPVEPEKPKPAFKDEVVVHEVNFAKPPVAAPRPTGEAVVERLNVVVAQSLKQLLDKHQAAENNSEEENEKSHTIAIGTSCQNNGCSAQYAGPQSLDETCTYHSGVPVFHEGMKFWSCCQRKTSDFDNFLQQEGCTKGKHNFVKQKKSSDCRYDWFQTGNDVTINIYAKATLPVDSCVSANSVSLVAHVEYDYGDSVFDLNIPLWGAVDIANSRVTMNASKVEIRLRKANPISWPKLMYVVES